MVKDALAGSRLIGIVQARRGPESSQPPIYSIGCAGRIEGVAELEDGRSNIVLRGVSRFHIDEELPSEPGRLYRVARVSPLIEKVLDEEALTESLAHILHEIGQIDEGMSLLARTDEAPKAMIVNMLAQLLPLGEVERQTLVEAPTIDARARLLAEILDFARLSRAAPSSDSDIKH